MKTTYYLDKICDLIRIIERDYNVECKDIELRRVDNEVIIDITFIDLDLKEKEEKEGEEDE